MDAPAQPVDELAAHYLAALATPGVGPARLRDLVEAYGGLAGVLGGEPVVLERPDAQLTRLAREVAAALPAALRRARREVDEARAAGLRVVCWEDAAYPPALLEDDRAAPPVVFVAGDLPPQVMRPFAQLASCALVGARRASQPALAFARDLARAAAHHGLVVVSGLALGVDSAAHEGALEAPAGSGATVAVLGGGHGRLHPAANRGLAERILRHGGAVLSEWPPAVNPQPHHFLRRNRLIACLARVVGVVEAGARSGALNTASHAAELGRTVLAVPGRPQDVRNRGALELLRDGAAPLIDAGDLLHHFGLSMIETPKADQRGRGGGSAVVPAPA
ncbi:MAG: DNA-protecting protein DprA, partial [Trueperaceae bacterium]|nr:DNA-protecting protein DprA [Trueperaceae bacterium]